MSLRFALLGLLCVLSLPAQPYVDGSHQSQVLGESRRFRLFLPPDYEQSGKRYPVVYYFHGHSDRYTLEHYDKGLDTVPKIAAFVQKRELIVVSVDGYVARDYTGFYGGAPWDVGRDGGQFDFGEYFLELVRYIDSHYRTRTGRRWRATSGLSMGGFMSLYLSARYPDLVGSVSAFNPGPEFFVGEPDRRSLWRPKDHVANHEQSMVRLVRASGDYISQYHEETRAAYAPSRVDFEYRQDEYHRHWATSVAETLEFHMRAFANPALDVMPTEWNYTSAHRRFGVWDTQVQADCPQAALISLEHVRQGGLRVGTRQWAPDGPPGGCTTVRTTTAPHYRAGATYRLLDYDVVTGTSQQQEVQADSTGRLTLTVAGGVHELSFAGPGTGREPPVLLPLTLKDHWRVLPGHVVPLPVRLYNPRTTAQAGVRVQVSSSYPTVEIVTGRAEIREIAPGTAVELAQRLQVRFTAGDGDYTRTRLQLRVTYDDWQEQTYDIDVLVAPDHLQAPLEMRVLDGRKETFAVFRQQGNQGGGQAIERSVAEGRGNGNGVLEPGEEATIWLKLRQGIDPFDKGNWCRAQVYVESRYVTEAADLQESKQREWTGAQNRTRLLKLAGSVPPGTEIPLVLDCESWSFQSQPDVRYGRERLYQPFQVHRHHLFLWTWRLR